MKPTNEPGNDALLDGEATEPSETVVVVETDALGRAIETVTAESNEARNQWDEKQWRRVK